jgi:hypothetical protein
MEGEAAAIIGVDCQPQARWFKIFGKALLH